jgi:hypothetical protein
MALASVQLQLAAENPSESPIFCMSEYIRSVCFNRLN